MGEFPAKVRAIFLSDLHLGYRVSRGERCLEILQNVRAEMVYLVGDIVDEVRLRDFWHWPDSHRRTFEQLIESATPDARVFFTPGNHDLSFRSADPLEGCSQELELILRPFLGFETADRLVHETIDGRKYLITHGDLYDDSDSGLGRVRSWGARLFDRFNTMLPRQVILSTRAFFKLLLARPSKTQQRVVQAARSEGLDGVIFGHLHEPRLQTQNGMMVANCGDWVVNESFVIETLDGQLQLFNFGKQTC